MIALLSLFLFAAAPDSTEAQVVNAREALLHYVAPHDATANAEGWRFAWADLNGDKLKDAIAFSTDKDWCSADGCTILVLEAVPAEDQEELGPFTVAAEISGVDAPVQMLASRSNGWCDLSVIDSQGRTVRLAFDGESYPFSSASAPATASPADVVLFAAR